MTVILKPKILQKKRKNYRPISLIKTDAEIPQQNTSKLNPTIH